MSFFVGIDISDDVTDALQAAVEQIRSRVHGSFRWVRAEKWHVTLAFLGKVDPSTLSALKNSMDQIGADHESFELSALGLLVVPEPTPRMLWANIGKEAELVSLQEALGSAICGFGDSKELHSFRPHVTLARFDSIKAPEKALLKELAIQEPPIDFGGWKVTSFSLFESKNGSYNRLHRTYLSSRNKP